jgi:hypothetical protein
MFVRAIETDSEPLVSFSDLFCSDSK